MQQREIKFRAWLKERGEMVEVEEIDFVRGCVCHENVQRDRPLDEEPRSDTYPIRVTPLEQVQLMQFTGLRDKDGKEIFEGDIVKDMKATPNIGIVFWHAGAFYLEWQMRSNDGTKPVEMSTDRCFEYATIIGNVHENPELLEKK